ncbi:Sterol carrier protein 2 [Aphelenchoides besseyi]|nr:Sterol carrier protein 2 [Aphelenchoides besseyi]
METQRTTQLLIMSKSKVFVVGVGMTPFTKPGSTGKDYPELVKDAVTEALNDCGLKYSDVQQAAVGYLYGGSCCAQRALYDVQMTGIPIYNVNNACASGSTAIYFGKQLIEGGGVDVFLAVGFEKMKSGSLDGMAPKIDDRAVPADKHIKVVAEEYGWSKAPAMCQFFGNAGVEHMKKYGTKREHFAKIGYKNHLHSVHNPRSQFRDKYTLDQVVNARKVFGPLGLLECSPTSDGSAAVILVSERWLEKHPNLRSQAVEIVGQELTTDLPSAYNERSAIKAIGFDMAQLAAQRLFTKAKLTPNDVQVIELHDCFATNELITYEALGLCPIGKAGEFIDRNDNTYGGKFVINPSGGLISKGHPIGATGVAQCVELCNQLRGRCDRRQVPNVRVALQHNLGKLVDSFPHLSSCFQALAVRVFLHFTDVLMVKLVVRMVFVMLVICKIIFYHPKPRDFAFLLIAQQGFRTKAYQVYSFVFANNADQAAFHKLQRGNEANFCRSFQFVEMSAKTKVYVIGVGMTAFTKPGSTGKDYPEMVKEAVTDALDDCHLQYNDIQQATVGYLYGGTCCGQRSLYEIGLSSIPIYNDFRPSGNAGQEHMEKYGTKREHFAKIGYKNHLHSVNNPKSQFQKKYSLEDVLKARKIHDVLGFPTSDGAAAVVVVSERWLQKHPQLRSQAVEIVGMEMGTDLPSVFAENSNIKMIGFDMVQGLAQRLYKNTGLTPNDVQVIELHDCFASNELITYEAIGLCPVGRGGFDIVDRNDNTYGGKWVINPSGGLISKGHPIGATGVAQCVELCNQLRGRCGKRQVENARVAMQHNIGIGGACVVALYRKADAGEVREIVYANTAADSAFESDEKELAKQAAGSYRFTLTSVKGNKKSWTVDLKKSPPYVGTESSDKVDVELILKDSDFVLISQGKLNPNQAFMQQKMKIKGDIMKAMKLKTILDPSQLKPKL